MVLMCLCSLASLACRRVGGTMTFMSQLLMRESPRRYFEREDECSCGRVECARNPFLLESRGCELSCSSVAIAGEWKRHSVSTDAMRTSSRSIIAFLPSTGWGGQWITSLGIWPWGNRVHCHRRARFRGSARCRRRPPWRSCSAPAWRRRLSVGPQAGTP